MRIARLRSSFRGADLKKFLAGAMSENSITRILSNTQAVDEAGAEAIWKEFLPRLLRVIETKLHGMPKRYVDQDDIAQNAMHSLFKGLQGQRFSDVSNCDELWRLLVTITVRKISAQRRRSLAAKRGGGKVRGESVFVNDANAYGINQILDTNSMSESAEKILQTYQEMLPRITDEASVQTLLLRMEGYSNAEIADRLKCSISRVEQRMAKIRRNWMSEIEAENSELK